MYNKAFLIGNLTRDPEVRFTPSGIPVAKFSIAVNRPKNKQTGAQEVDFINIVAWRRLAEICRDYLKKGSPVSIEGRLEIRKYEKAGEKKTFAEVVADSMQMLGKKQDTTDVSKMQEEAFSSGTEEKKENKDEEVPF